MLKVVVLDRKYQDVIQLLSVIHGTALIVFSYCFAAKEQDVTSIAMIVTGIILFTYGVPRVKKNLMESRNQNGSNNGDDIGE